MARGADSLATHVPDLPGVQLDSLAWAYGASPDPVFATDNDGRVVFVNGAAEARWGKPETILLASSIFPVAFREKAIELAARALLGESGRLEWGEAGVDSVRCWFASTFSPVYEGPIVVASVCYSTDITALKQSEARLRRSEQLMVDVQGVAHLGTWEWDVTEPNAIWSPELYRIYGLTPETYTPSYERYLTMVHPDDRQRVIDATNQVFKEHVPYSHDERIFRPDGSIRHLHTWAYPILDEHKRLTKLVGVCQDITERALAEEAVRKLADDLEVRVAERTRVLESAMQDLEAFNSIVSHDLRNPLAAIQLTCDQLVRSKSAELTPQTLAKIHRARRAAVRMGVLIDDLIVFARAGKTPMESMNLDLSQLSLRIIEALQQESPERSVEVVVAPGLRCRGDAGLLHSALENLLSNAWKYSSKAPHARIEVGSVPDASRPTFFVRDNGAGFDMKDVSRLFNPFQRLHSAAEFDGTGLGLAAVHRIIERHGGTIRADAAPGQGATFWFELPAAQ